VQECFVQRSNAHRKEKSDSSLKHSSLHIRQSKMEEKKIAKQNVFYTFIKKNFIKYIQWLQK
jgi:hypothetical protein